MQFVLHHRSKVINSSRQRACLHGDKVTLLGGSPFYKGQKISPLYMQSLVPRANAIIEFGAERHNCEVAKYKTTKNGGQAKCNVYFGGNFPCAFLFGCRFSLLWVLLIG